MGFLKPAPVERPHLCSKPGAALAFPEGTRWQCDECRQVYRVEQIVDRNILEIAWVAEPLTARHLLGEV